MRTISTYERRQRKKTDLEGKRGISRVRKEFKRKKSVL